MSCKPVTFKRITRAQFQAIRARINAQAEVKSTGDSGTARGQGMAAVFAYDETAQSLTIQVTEKPFFVSEAVLQDKMLALVDQAKAVFP